jgi:hypothetical protein
MPKRFAVGKSVGASGEIVDFGRRVDAESPENRGGKIAGRN